MNFLAHLYLSKDNQNIMIGNFIADAIRGNKFKHFPAEIQKGIILHRHIDTFTDQHPIVRISKRRLHERYGHYDGVIIDLFYDHFFGDRFVAYFNRIEIYTGIQIGNIQFESVASQMISILRSVVNNLSEYITQGQVDVAHGFCGDHDHRFVGSRVRIVLRNFKRSSSVIFIDSYR